MSKRLVVPFSGGCYSGKTTTMLALKDKYEKLGYNVKILDEPLRRKTNKTIDEVRKDAHSYLLMQEEIINERIDREKSIDKLDGVDLVFIDRAITDTLFYFTFYVDKSSLSDEDMKLYVELFNKLNEFSKDAFERIYDIVPTFKPVTNIKDDAGGYRPNSLKTTAMLEYEMIKMYSRSYDKYNKMMNIDLNNNSDRQISLLNTAIDEMLELGKLKKN